MRTTWIALGISFLLLNAGCNARKAAAPAVTAADLGKLGFAIASYEDGLKKAPGAAADLKPFLASSAQEVETFQKVADGRVVVIWGAPAKGMKAGPAMTVLAYARDVPTAGGLVLFGSGEV